jgi:hypothetical protein
MISKGELVTKLDYIVPSFLILIFQVVQYLDFNLRLLVKACLVSYNLKRHICLSFMIKRLHNSSKTAFPKQADNFIAISYVIFVD